MTLHVCPTCGLPGCEEHAEDPTLFEWARDGALESAAPAEPVRRDTSVARILSAERTAQ
jgi:hypothetical protein